MLNRNSKLKNQNKMKKQNEMIEALNNLKAVRKELNTKQNYLICLIMAVTIIFAIVMS